VDGNDYKYRRGVFNMEDKEPSQMEVIIKIKGFMVKQIFLDNIATRDLTQEDITVDKIISTANKTSGELTIKWDINE